MDTMRIGGENHHDLSEKYGIIAKNSPQKAFQAKKKLLKAMGKNGTRSEGRPRNPRPTPTGASD